MSNYKFAKLNNDPEIQQLQREAEDNFATQTDLSTRMAKTTGIVTDVPTLTSMSDGEEIAYDDGTNQWLYRRIGSKLYKYQLTEV